MRAPKRLREVTPRPEESFQALLAHFSAATRELTPSLKAVEFADRLADRSRQLLGARAVVFAARRDGAWEISALSGTVNLWDAGTQSRLADTLADQFETRAARRPVPAEKLLGAELAHALSWNEIACLPLDGSEGPLGVLCIADSASGISEMQWQVLEAAAAHAAITLENGRLFAQVENSKKQWVGDFDAISDFILVHDAACRVLRLNRSLADALDVQPPMAVGRDMSSFELLGARSRQDECAFCRNGKTSHEEFVHANGNRTYLISTARVSSSDGLPRTIHVMKDITDRREAERRYCRERDFNKSIVDNTQSMILVLDAAGRVSYANRRCAEAGFRHALLLGRALTDLVLPARRTALADALGAALRGSPKDHLELSLQAPNGAVRHFSTSLSPMRDDHGEISRVVVVMNEATDAIAVQAKLQRTEKMAALGQLVAGVAHEVNNPLAAIVGFTDLLLESSDTTERAKQELRVILQEAQRTRSIVQNLLSFARQMPAQREPLQIRSALQQTLKLRAYDFSRRGVRITEKYDDDLPLVIADAQQLQQVLLNILNNAYDALVEVRRPGRLDIAIFRRGAFAEISVRDNGPGISHPERIFDPFFTTKEVGKGTGLGLSICYGIVRAHGGEITAANNEDGLGCTFTVRLPIATRQFAPHAEPDATFAPPVLVENANGKATDPQ